MGYSRSHAGRMTYLKTNRPTSVAAPSNGKTVSFAVLTVACIFIFFGSATAGAESGLHAPYLIIHVDAVPSRLFFEEYDAGHLPNIKAVFDDGKLVRHAVSPFFAGTEMLYPRLKTGAGPDQPLPITWEMYDRNSGRHISRIETQVILFSHLPTYSLTQIIHGIPGMDYLSGWALLNTPRLLDEYDIVEFFWFITDSYGHVFGEEAQRESLLILDEFLGILMKQLGSKPVNLVIYADHGMSMFERTYDAESAMAETAGDNEQFVYYPNLYLKDRTLAATTAEQLANRDEIDFAFYRADEFLIIGIHKEGQVMFRSEGNLITYSCEGPDPFGYADLGCLGRPLSDQDWLEMTCTSRYPAVPVQIVRYMDNALSGDIVAVLNPPKGLRTTVGFCGCHTGFVDTDCVVGVLMKGPDIDPSQIPDTFWLYEMYSQVLKIDPQNPTKADRAKNFFMVSDGGIDLQLSAFRNNTALSIGPQEWTFIGETTIARSFITQVRAGLGLASDKSLAGGLTPVASLRLDIYFGPLTYDHRNTIALTDGCRKSTSTLRFEAKNGVVLEWEYPNRIKLGVSW